MISIEETAEAVGSFLESCQISGNQAYDNFKEILEALKNEKSRSQARRFLSLVEKHLQKENGDGECITKYHFGLHELALNDMEDPELVPPLSPRSGGTPHGGRRQKLKLLELPSIFIPEAWSFTFFEGLSRHPETGFRDRDVCELGTGNGWISLALAERWGPRKVIGIDINPRAIKVAWINLYMNALSPDGSLIYDRDGKTLLDRVEFHVSDLLQHCLENKLYFDRVIGCIPQVLNPDPEAMLKKVSEQASEDFLYDLSNYCGLQGFVEDQFGLGLIARALEESIEVVKPTGAVILNMGGRPGQAVCERMYERRGFGIKKLWQTRVIQAADTDILALVEIERNSRHRFEFYMGEVSNEPISARTAWAYSKSGGAIAHGLSVYEARLRQPNQVKTIFQFLRKDGYEDTRSALDLAFPSEAVADEKISFLATLARALEAAESFPYDQPAGNEHFRSQIAAYLKLYFRIPISLQNVVVLRSRPVAIENLLRLYCPGLALVDSAFTRWLPKRWTSSLPEVLENVNGNSGEASKLAASTSDDNPVVLEAPRRADLVVQLVRHLKPRVVVTSLESFEMQTSAAFEQLLGATAEVGTRLFLDISDHLELSSKPGNNGVLAYMATHPLPPHAALLCGLVKNQVYSDLRVCFVVSENRDLLSALVGSLELTSSRTPAMNQLYYGCVLHELLSFQIRDRYQTEERPLVDEASSGITGRFVPLSDSTIAALRHPAVNRLEIATAGGAIHDTTVEMAGEMNDLPTPNVIKKLIFEGFARQNVTESEADPRPEIHQILQERFGLNPDNTKDILLGDGASPLFARVMHALVEENGTLFVPSGANGNLIATATFFRVRAAVIPTSEANQFKLTAEAVQKAFQGIKNPWLALCAPLVNPTGALYTEPEIKSILAVCRSFGARVVLDTCFGSLIFPDSDGTTQKSLPSDFSQGTPAKGVHKGQWSLEESLTAVTPDGTTGSPASTFTLLILGGISKEFSAGGLRFGYAAVRDPQLLETLREGGMSRPHGTLRYAVKKTLALTSTERSSSALASALEDSRAILKERADELVKVLNDNGWRAIQPQGGLSVVATPKAYLGKSFSYETSAGKKVTVTLDSENIVEAMFHSVGLLINGSAWTGIPDFCHFIVSIEYAKFKRGVQLIHEFGSLVLGQ